MLLTIQELQSKYKENERIKNLNVGVAYINLLDSINTKLKEQVEVENDDDSHRGVVFNMDDEIRYRKITGVRHDVDEDFAENNLLDIKGDLGFVKRIVAKETPHELYKNHKEVIFRHQDTIITFGELLNDWLFSKKVEDVLRVELKQAGFDFVLKGSHLLIPRGQFIQ